MNCQGLDRVEVQAGDAGLDVRLFTGYHPNAIACLAIAVPWGTTVTLDEPIILQDQG